MVSPAEQGHQPHFTELLGHVELRTGEDHGREEWARHPDAIERLARRVEDAVQVVAQQARLPGVEPGDASLVYELFPGGEGVEGPVEVQELPREGGFGLVGLALHRESNLLLALGAEAVAHEGPAGHWTRVGGEYVGEDTDAELARDDILHGHRLVRGAHRGAGARRRGLRSPRRGDGAAAAPP
jgi:hypothetical protein